MNKKKLIRLLPFFVFLCTIAFIGTKIYINQKEETLRHDIINKINDFFGGGEEVQSSDCDTTMPKWWGYPGDSFGGFSRHYPGWEGALSMYFKYSARMHFDREPDCKYDYAWKNFDYLYETALSDFTITYLSRSNENSFELLEYCPFAIAEKAIGEKYASKGISTKKEFYQYWTHRLNLMKNIYNSLRQYHLNEKQVKLKDFFSTMNEYFYVEIPARSDLRWWTHCFHSYDFGDWKFFIRQSECPSIIVKENNNSTNDFMEIFFISIGVIFLAFCSVIALKWDYYKK